MAKVILGGQLLSLLLSLLVTPVAYSLWDDGLERGKRAVARLTRSKPAPPAPAADGTRETVFDVPAAPKEKAPGAAPAGS